MMVAMKAERRRDRILRLIRSNASITNQEIGSILGASRETIRNDLIQLAKMGLVVNDHGKHFLSDDTASLRELSKRGILSVDQRQNEILQFVEQSGIVRNKQLAAELNVSPGTIRNDLINLEKQGRIRRRHGSAVVMEDISSRSLLPILLNLPFSSGVRNIGERGIGLIEQGDLVFLDDSACSAYIALNLPTDREVNILTNSLKVAVTLFYREFPGSVFFLPGTVQREGVSTDLQFAEPFLARFLITKAFLGFAAYTRERGFFAASHKQVEVRSHILGITQSAYVLLESEKVGTNGKYGFSIERNLGQIKEIIIDDGLTIEQATQEFPESLPLVICGENYVVKSPFNKQYIVGFATLHGKYEYSRLVREGIERAANKYNNVELIVADNKMDRQATLANIENFIQRKVNLVIEYQHDYSLSVLIGEKLSHAKIPVIAVDIPIPGAVYFGANNYLAGIMGGEAAAREVKRRWSGSVDRLIVVTDTAVGPLPESRITGMLEAFLKVIPTPQQDIIRVDSGNDPEAVDTMMTDILEKLPPASRTMVFSINSNVTMAIVKVIVRLGLPASTLVVGQNVTPQIASEMSRENSPLIGAVGFFPEKYGEQIMELAMKILRKHPVGPDNYIGHKWIDRSFPQSGQGGNQEVTISAERSSE
jgi:ribose transport system substrate-binding protein